MKKIISWTCGAILLVFLIALLSGCSQAASQPLYVIASNDANGDGQFDDQSPGPEAPAIYRLQVEGKEIRLGRLTDPTLFIPNLYTLSPDGKRLAYSTQTILENEIGQQIYIQDLTRNSLPLQVPYDASMVHALYWSRDNKNLAVVASDSVGKDEVLIVAPDGTIERSVDVQLFAQNELQDYTPLVAPDMSQSLWPQGAAGGSLYTVSESISTPGPGDPILTEYPMTFVDWSPDSQRILLLDSDPTLQDQFGQLPKPHGALFSIQPDGSNLKGLTAAGGSSIIADWSPDGLKIAYLTLLEDTNNDGKADSRLPAPVLYLQGEDGKAQRISLGDQYRLGWSLDW